MNLKMIYFVLFLLLGRHIISVEKLEMNDMMADKMNKIKQKMNRDKKSLGKDNNNDPELNSNYNDDLNNEITGKIDKALGKYNSIVIDSDDEKIEEENIENKPEIKSNNEKAGGLSYKLLTVGFILLILHLIKK